MSHDSRRDSSYIFLERQILRNELKISFGKPFQNVQLAKQIHNQLIKVKKYCLSGIHKQNHWEILDENDFIRLDNYIKIDKEDPKIKSFNKAVTKFVELIAGYLSKTIENIRFCVIPAGSFPLNLRKPDEFDFVLVYEVQRLPSQPKNMAVRPILHTFYTHIRDILDHCDVLTIEKNHAVNVIISWSCHCHQEHAVHIDLAFSTKTDIIVEDYLKDKGLPLRGTPFENCLDRNKNVYMNLGASDSNNRIDTNLFDKCFFSLCNKISPNIKMIYRIMKYIRDFLFPKHHKYLR